MKPLERLPASVVATPQTHPYHASISTSASSSSSSVFSADGSSQSSDVSHDTSVSSASPASSDRIIWDAEDPFRSARLKEQAPVIVRDALPSIVDDIVPSALRRNPRRCSNASAKRPPSLVRQSERKGQFVECLVDSATQMVQVIWPLSVPHCPNEPSRGGVLPLRTFIQETLRRSRTSFSTLQVALYYLILIKAHIPNYNFTMEQREDSLACRALQCGRRMFLAALILASKYLQDKNYSARAWSRISGLKTDEINTNEMAFLKAVNWKLHVPEPLFERWQDILIKYTAQLSGPLGANSSPSTHSWMSTVTRLTPALDTIDALPHKKPNPVQPEPWRVHTIPLRMMDHDSTPVPRSPVTPMPPRFLEPSPHVLPPTPVRLGRLPTPMLTPQSTTSNTPAVSLAGFGSGRPSMCSAMSQVQNSCMARSVMDCHWKKAPSSGLEAYHFSSRRPSVQSLSGSSLTSSPDSMITDNFSHSSRASSISSVASSASANVWAPIPVRLNRLATMRCAGLPRPTTCASQPLPHRGPEVAFMGSLSTMTTLVDPMSSPEMDVLKLSDMDYPSALPRDLESPSRGRKRGRSSADLSLHQHVREFLDPNLTSYHADLSSHVLPDRACAQPSSFLQSPCAGMRTPTSGYTIKSLQSPARSVSDMRLPVQRDLGRKRACCASEANLLTFNGGPGMWAGIL